MFSKVPKFNAGWVGLAAISVLGLGLSAVPVQAVNLVPQQEGEVQLDNLGCLTGTCLELDDSIFKSVVSEKDSSTGTYSYLFVDKKGTSNVYNDTINGGTFTFKSVDLGTTEPEGQYWFRPVAVNEYGQLLENGELEVGTFTFEFVNKLSELTLSFFDTEKGRGTTSFKVFYENGASEAFTVAKGPNSNIQTFTVNDIQKITLNLGERYGRTGDGVNFQGTASIPEPSMVLGAIAAMCGGGLLRKRPQSGTEA